MSALLPDWLWKSAALTATQALKSRMEYRDYQAFSNHTGAATWRMQTTIKSQKAVQSSNGIPGRDPTRLTPRFLSLPHVFDFIRERYDVVPDDNSQCCLDKIPEQTKSGTEILGADCDPDLGKKAFNPGVG